MSTSLRNLLAEDQAVVVPVAVNPLSAQIAANLGFQALYVGGGALGYVQGITEANLSLDALCEVAVSVRTVCDLPLILDGQCGWGDPMHTLHTVQRAEAAGFSAIEIEDQLVPKRAHHHVGVEHLVPFDYMRDKVAAAAAARRSEDFLVIGRTNACRQAGLDEALRRGEMMRAAGADILFVLHTDMDEVVKIGERLGGPLMFTFAWGGTGLGDLGLTISELKALGYALVVDPMTPVLAMHRALRDSYTAILNQTADPLVGLTRDAEWDEMHRTIDLDRMLTVEAASVGP